MAGWKYDEHDVCCNALEFAPYLIHERSRNKLRRWNSGARGANEGRRAIVGGGDIHMYLTPVSFIFSFVDTPVDFQPEQWTGEARTVHRYLHQSTESKGGKNKAIDNINELPDDVLSSILSFLPMRDAVQARSLSSRWRYLSPTPFNLEFSNDSANSWNDKSIFLAQVDQILQQCEKTIRKVDSFKLHYCLANKDACHIDRWITFVVMMKTKKLDLDFSPPLENVKSYIFPCHLLREMPYLKHLCLAVCDLRYSPDCTTTSTLNSLKHIDLQLVDLDQSALDTILSGCMNLEFLRLKRCMLPRELSIHGPFRCLKLLALFDCYGAYKLEILSVDHVEPLIPERMGKLNCLKELELIICLTEKFDLLSLASVLRVCPNVQKFHVNIHPIKAYQEGEMVRWRYNKHQQELYHGLKEVEIDGFCDICCNALEFAQYLIRGAVGLELMIIRMNDWCEVITMIDQYELTDELKKWFYEEKERVERALSNEKMDANNTNLRLICECVLNS
ncbi:hypothetical protein LguiA_021599 [Lonicera macranthoides]